MKRLYFFAGLLFLILTFSCKTGTQEERSPGAGEILGNPYYQAVSFGGFRAATRDTVPTVSDLKEDMQILSALGIRILRTYNTQQFPHAAHVLQAIHELKLEDPDFEMYVMLGAWIDCKDAWTPSPDHTAESLENNKAEVEAAVQLAKRFPDIVKIIAVGNEAMVHWASSYFVGPEVILKWVNYLQELKKTGELPEDLWITSSDNFASWGGADSSYHTAGLTALIEAVDYISLHTYPFHDTHYNHAYWTVPAEEQGLSEMEKIDAAMKRALLRAKEQYDSVASYVAKLGFQKPIHIGETGWASLSDGYYSAIRSKAADEYKQKLYFDGMRNWTNQQKIACFYFEAFDEKWKDQSNPLGSENHFGLINLKNEVKFALWHLVDENAFEGLTRNGLPLVKSYGGNEALMLEQVLAPPATGTYTR